MNIALEKSRARLQAKQKRQEVYNQAAGAELIKHFPAYRFRGKIIAGFWPLQNEIDIRPLMEALHEMGHDLALPCTPRTGHPLTFRAWQPDDRLKSGSFGTKEPFPEKPERQPDIVILPLLAFTRLGERLGYGGGFYDRTIAKLRANGEVFTCGAAFAGQEAACLPTDQHDQRLDAILTETYFKDI